MYAIFVSVIVVTAVTLAIIAGPWGCHVVCQRVAALIDAVAIVVLSMFILWVDSNTVDPDTWGAHPLIVFGVDRVDSGTWDFDIKARLNIEAGGDGILSYRLVASYEASDNPGAVPRQPPSPAYCGDGAKCKTSPAAADVSVSFVAPPHVGYDMSGIRCGDGELLRGKSEGDLPGTFAAVRSDAISGLTSARYPTSRSSESERRKRVDAIDGMMLPTYRSRLGISYETYVNGSGMSRYYMPEAGRTVYDSGNVRTETCIIPSDVLWGREKAGNPLGGFFYMLRDKVMDPTLSMRVPAMMATDQQVRTTSTLRGFAGIVDVNGNVDSPYSLSSNVDFSSNWGNYWSYDYDSSSTDDGILFTDMPNVFLTPVRKAEQKAMLLTSLGILWPVLFILGDVIMREVSETSGTKTGGTRMGGKA